MPENIQQPIQLPPPANVGAPPAAKPDEEDDEAAKQELAQSMPTKEKLRELAKKNQPLPEWFDEEEEAPF